MSEGGRHRIAPGAPVVIKAGSSSLVRENGELDADSLGRTVDLVSGMREQGHPTLLVTSGAVAAGLPVLGLERRPMDAPGFQVAAAIGQGRLMERYTALFGGHGLVVGQVLLTKDLLANRTQYLNARGALERMLALGVVPIINENDTVVVEGLRLGDNDRLAAIVSHLVGAGILIILTDTEGLYSADPRTVEDAELLVCGEPRRQHAGRGDRGACGAFRVRGCGDQSGGGAHGGLVRHSHGDRQRPGARGRRPSGLRAGRRDVGESSSGAFVGAQAVDRLRPTD